MEALTWRALESLVLRPLQGWGLHEGARASQKGLHIGASIVSQMAFTKALPDRSSQALPLMWRPLCGPCTEAGRYKVPAKAPFLKAQAFTKGPSRRSLHCSRCIVYRGPPSTGAPHIGVEAPPPRAGSYREALMWKLVCDKWRRRSLCGGHGGPY